MKGNAINVYEQSNLTNNQLQVWLAQNLVPEAPIYNLAVALHIEGEIDPDHFSRAFRILVDSSDALRTVVEEYDGIPVQRILPQAPAMIDFHDFSEDPEAEARARNLMAARCEIPIDWRRTAYDTTLIKIAPKHFAWYLNVHHIVCDGWSFEVIYRHMADLYRASVEGRLPDRVALPAFADYLDYERDFRCSLRHKKAQAYWSQALAHGGESVNFYGKLPLRATTRVRRISHELGADRTARLKSAVAASTGASESAALFNVFAAALVGYLYCLNAGDDYCIGVPFHNRRSHSAFKETIGFFSEVLPVRVTLAEDETLASLSKKFASEVRKAMRYGQHSVTNPVFKRLYDLTLNYHVSAFSDFAGIPARPEWLHNGHGDESLGIHIRNFASSDSLTVDFDLHDAVFDEPDGERVVAHFMRVVDTFLQDPEKRVRTLSLTSQEEARHLLLQWHGQPEVPSDQRPVHEIFQQRATEGPDQPAVLSESGTLTYGELNRRANSIATMLLARGVGPQALVVIFLTRSPELIAAILGVLKAGAAYVPIDPHYSSEWLKFILEDTGAAVLLTERKLLAEIPENAVEVICLDNPGVVGEPVDENVREVVSDDDLSYVIYTSGSAGTPKGVEITHRALANFASEAARIFELKPSDRILQFASISFDTSAEEIFPCLISGGTLVLCCGPECIPADTFLEQCRTWQITVLDLPTAYWHELTAGLFADRLTVCDPIRLVIIGGERAIPERLALWQAFVGGRARLLNTYGPTEATVAATVAELTHAPAECGVAAEVSIGQPIANVQTLVLDHNLNPVPEGVPGELYIGGVGLARAYVGRPDLTAEKFIPNPFDIYSGSRLYRTGDIVRHFDDGKLEFLRRSDDQIKVRGFRVELEGIAAVLRQHPLVRDAAVVQEGAPNSGRLVACVVPEGAAVLNLKDLQSFVRARLPEYMVPSDLISLEVLPLTPRGKLDRRALLLAPSCQPKNLEPLVPPQTPVETRIADLWGELLSLQAIGRDQHFFELGGHSLLAAQAISRIRREWQVDIPLRVIFEAPTVASLAERVEQALRERSVPAETTPVPLAAYNGEVPASDSQARIWYMDQFAPESSAYNITAAIRFTGSLDRQALQQSIDRLVERHESLRTTVRNIDGLPMQVIGSATPMALVALDLTNSPEEGRVEKAKEILREEGRRPFDLSVGPLLRLLLLRLNDDDHVLLLIMHHLISDQWSLNVIAREVSSLYNGFRNGDTPALEPLAAQYGDFALWQSHRLTPDRLRQGLRYWKNQLAGVEASAFPSDRPNSPTQTFRGAYRSFSLPNQLLERLRALALEENATLYMVFLAIFKALLSRYSDRENVAIGSPVTNRTQSEWEGIIGTFINILVLRTDLSGNPSLRQIIQRVRDTVLGGFTNQDVPFQKVVEELVPGRDGGRTPFVQVLFNFQSTPVGKVDFEGISWAPFEIDQWAAQFDVSVTIDPEITRRAFVSYNTDLYEASTIDRIIGHYVRLLEAAAQNADQSLAAASLLLVEEPTSQTKARDDLELPIPEKCVHELFEAQARRMPDAIALVYQEQRLTYKELNERSNQLAYRLRALGAGPERLVGIVLDRSPELLIGILAVLKSGAAYIPVDPAYPEERIAFICQDSCMAAVLTQKSLLAALPKKNLPVLCLDETIASAGTTENLAVLTRSDELAYVIYTSGSTGTPKGVEISHRALTNFLYSMKQAPSLNAADVLFSVTTISFDIAALELFLPLIVGARVVIASREVAADGERLVADLASGDATVMQATPTTWRMIIDAGWESKTNFKIICGGEPLPLGLAQGLLSRSDSVWNLYGPTETTVWSALWAVEPDCERISIGRPIHNTQIFVLDSTGLPVPVGVPGELYIGGEGLARGYLNRPELTAEKFVPNPFGAPSSRLYRT
ncbi:MAG: amino acid adenylation domain-containing protein, partial [Chloroflexota bacterium]